MSNDEKGRANVELAKQKSGNGNQATTHDPQKVAAYVCDMAKNLKTMTAAADLKFLTYLLDMVQIESMNIISDRKSGKTGEWN